MRRPPRPSPARVVSGDHRKVIDAPDLDAVLVLTPDHTHADLACAALLAGKPAFVEKPLDITVERCDEILRTARDTGTRLYVGHNMRHMPVVRMMRDLIGRGAIGTVKTVWVRHFVGYGGDWYFKDWHAERRYTTGLLLQKAAHDIDVVHWLSGGYTRDVQAMGDLMVYGDNPHRRAPGEPKTDDWYTEDGHWPPPTQRALNPVIDIEDVSLLNMRLDNGVLASYQQCHFTPDYWRNYTVIGDAGRLENFGDGPGGQVKVWNSRRSALPRRARRDVRDPQGRGRPRPRRRRPADHRGVPALRTRGRRHRHLAGGGPDGGRGRLPGDVLPAGRRHPARGTAPRPGTGGVFRAGAAVGDGVGARPRGPAAVASCLVGAVPGLGSPPSPGAVLCLGGAVPGVGSPPSPGDGDAMGGRTSGPESGS